MRRFAFKLEKILELRRHAERQWERKLADVTRRVVAVEREIEAWAVRRHDTARFGAGPGTVDMMLLQSREDYINRIDQRVRELQHQVLALETERAKVREDYVRASSRRKALTRLKERRSAEYYRGALREEARVLDEIAATRLIRARSETEEVDV